MSVGFGEHDAQCTRVVFATAALELIVTEATNEATHKAHAAVSALKLAAEAVRSHSEQLKKAMDNADVSNNSTRSETD